MRTLSIWGAPRGWALLVAAEALNRLAFARLALDRAGGLSTGFIGDLIP